MIQYFTYNYDAEYPKELEALKADKRVETVIGCWKDPKSNQYIGYVEVNDSILTPVNIVIEVLTKVGFKTLTIDEVIALVEQYWEGNPPPDPLDPSLTWAKATVENGYVIKKKIKAI